MAMKKPMLQRSGLIFLATLLGLILCYAVASRSGLLDRLGQRLLPSAQRAHLSSGDFPAGVTAPVGDIASIPLRPTRVGFVARGSAASLLLVTGGLRTEPSTSPKRRDGLLKTAYAMDAEAVVFAKEAELKRALAQGGETGGVDLAILSVDRLAEWGAQLRDAAPRTLLLLGHSRGQDALSAVGVQRLAQLKGKRISVYPFGPGYYFLLWVLSRANLLLSDVRLVELGSALDAGSSLREGRADATVGLFQDVQTAAKERGGQVLVSTTDCPHLIASVLVSRGDFVARYPVGIRRLVRALLDGAAAINRDAGPAARLLGEVAPGLGDPAEAIAAAPPAGLEENLAFFGLSGQSPVTYDELFGSASALFSRLGKTAKPPKVEDTRDLEPLTYTAEQMNPRGKGR